MTILIVTHDMQDAARVSDYTADFLGELAQFDQTNLLYTRPIGAAAEVNSVRAGQYVFGNAEMDDPARRPLRVSDGIQSHVDPPTRAGPAPVG